MFAFGKSPSSLQSLLFQKTTKYKSYNTIEIVLYQFVNYITCIFFFQSESDFESQYGFNLIQMSFMSIVKHSISLI